MFQIIGWCQSGSSTLCICALVLWFSNIITCKETSATEESLQVEENSGDIVGHKLIPHGVWAKSVESCYYPCEPRTHPRSHPVLYRLPMIREDRITPLHPLPLVLYSQHHSGPVIKVKRKEDRLTNLGEGWWNGAAERGGLISGFSQHKPSSFKMISDPDSTQAGGGWVCVWPSQTGV